MDPNGTEISCYYPPPFCWAFDKTPKRLFMNASRLKELEEHNIFVPLNKSFNEFKNEDVPIIVRKFTQDHYGHYIYDIYDISPHNDSSNNNTSNNSDKNSNNGNSRNLVLQDDSGDPNRRNDAFKFGPF